MTTMLPIEMEAKLMQAQRLLAELYEETTDPTLNAALSCADTCIWEAVNALHRHK